MININEELLECYRLKYLALFYQKEKEDIKKFIMEKCGDKNTLVKAERSINRINNVFDSIDILSTMIF